jgi:hypothetical protein
MSQAEFDGGSPIPARVSRHDPTVEARVVLSAWSEVQAVTATFRKTAAAGRLRSSTRPASHAPRPPIDGVAMKVLGRVEPEVESDRMCTSSPM